jgi:hypothetical protein
MRDSILATALLIAALLVVPGGDLVAEVGEAAPEHAPVQARVVASDHSSTVLDVELGLPYAEVTQSVGAGLVAIPPTTGVVPKVTAITVRRERPEGGWSEPRLEAPEGWTDVVSVSEPGIWRDLRIVSVSVMPRPADDVLVERMTVELAYEGTGPNPLLHPGRPVSPEFDRLYRGLVLNYDWLDVEPWSRSDAVRYLIIVADQLVQAGDSLGWWRNLTGMRAQVVSRSDIGGATPANYTQIRNYIQDAYDNWPQPPEFVVLMGDLGTGAADEQMPAYIQQDLLGLGSYASDHWYTLLDGSDYYADVFIGRIPSAWLSTTEYIVHKIVEYERDPLIDTGVTWQEKALMCAGHGGNYPSITDAKRWVGGKLFAYGLESVDSVYVPEMPGIDADAMIVAAVNQGRTIVNYRGDPTATSGWPQLDFTTTDIENYVHNGWRLPFVLSVSCYSGDYNGGACFGEYWLKKAEANGDPRGGVAFFGSTGWTHTLWNNWMDKGTFVGFCEDNVVRVTEATEYGKMWMLAQLGHSTTAENTFRQFSVLGDPGNAIWFDKPQEMQVTHPGTINPGAQAVTVWVKDQGGAPIVGALVCAWKGSETYEYGYTMVGGALNLAVDPVTAGTMLLTVTARNMLPYEGQIQVTPGDVTPPEAISDLSVSLTMQHHVVLSWTEVTQDTTGAAEIMDHYEVFRGTAAHFDPSGISPLASVPYGTTSYVDQASGVGQPGTNSFYTVVAVDQAGNRSAPSNRVGEFDYDSGP